MDKYEKNLTDEDIQVLKNTMQKYDDIKSPMKLMTQSIVTEQEKGLLKLMYFRFTDYVNQKQRADELAELYAQLEKESESLSISLCEMIEKNHERTTKLIQEKSKAVERADELEKRWSELKKTLLLYKDIPQSTQSFDTVFELMKEMEFKKEDNNA